MNLISINKIVKFSSIYMSRTIFNNLRVLLLNKKIINIRYNAKTFCIYTKRFRSVYSSFKMSRHQLKKFLDNKTHSNVYIK